MPDEYVWADCLVPPYIVDEPQANNRVPLIFLPSGNASSIAAIP